MNQGRIVNRKEFLTPATPSAVVEIMSRYSELKKGIVTIINRSPVVGRPLSQMLLNRDYTISVCHSKTPDIVQYTRRSDAVIAAIGKANFFTDELLNPDCTFIDVGINYVNGKVVGDGDFARLSKWIKRITPVPGGVGPITATMIFSNLLKAFKYQEKLP
jgi:methylenetetrahydrofolate dehydrogenase (NADP+)/methenyltetrahydrofolate cyclohydrolase